MLKPLSREYIWNQPVSSRYDIHMHFPWLIFFWWYGLLNHCSDASHLWLMTRYGSTSTNNKIKKQMCLPSITHLLFVIFLPACLLLHLCTLPFVSTILSPCCYIRVAFSPLYSMLTKKTGLRHIVNTLRLSQFGRYISLMYFDPNFTEICSKDGLTISQPALIQILDWRRTGDKPLSEPIMAQFMRHSASLNQYCRYHESSWTIVRYFEWRFLAIQGYKWQLQNLGSSCCAWYNQSE